uniref:IGFBP N-terminal domain-containing protein n=1 Tax=Anabas testudineus TaxID=64144 RepID=A0A3Q1KCW0_ANATE
MSTLTTPQLLLVALFFTHDLTGAGAVRSDQCASRCDVSSCPTPSCPGGYVPDRCNCCLVCSPREGDPCGRKNDLPCGAGLECKPLAPGRRRGSKRVCRCKTEHEVCGSDGRTYGNVCRMRAASRKARQTGRAAVSQAHKGRFLVNKGASMVHLSSPRYKFNFIADVVEKIAPAVVHIELFVRHPLFGRHMRLSSGSGFIVTHSGVIVTNAHVVTPAATVTGRPQLRVQLHGGEAYGAVVRDVDRRADIATVKINQKKLPVLSLGRSADLRPGEFVVAIGSPFALQNTVTTGIVSTAQRDGKELGIKDSDMDYIQTDAIINYGNSGGPLVNLDGEVIGINTLKVTAGIAFAIPSDRISLFLRCYLRNVQFHTAVYNRGYCTSVALRTCSNQIADYCFLSLRLRGGIKKGDVIVKVNGDPVETTEDIHKALQGDQPLLLEIHRGRDDLLFNIHPQVTLH